jgi:class 3 adenylate cyclase
VTAAIREPHDIERPRVSLPFWRRPRRLGPQIARTLVLTALAAVALFGALNYYAADRLLRDGTQEQLVSVAQARARSIELGTDRLLGRVSTASDDLGVARAVQDFDVAFRAAGTGTLEPPEAAALDDFYERNVLQPISDAELADLTLADVVPPTPAGRFVQYHYRVADTPAGDDTAYSDAMAEHDRFLTGLSNTIAGGDLLLISRATGEIVYSVNRRIDLGTSLVDGPHADSSLAELFRQDLRRVRAGEALLSDFRIYIPNGGRPVLFAASAIRSGNEIVGALAVEIPVTALDRITTADGNWAELGLGDGESYVVASDGVLQSTSRAWIEDPDGYLADIQDPEERRLVEVFGSPVGVLNVDTEPVTQAFEGQAFEGVSTNFLGRRTYSSSTSIDIPGVEWVVVTDVPLGDARRPLNDYLVRMAIVAAIVLPLTAIVGLRIAKRLMKPIRPALDAAEAVAGGERQLNLSLHRNDEFGDLARRLVRMASTLEQQEHALADEYERTRTMLLAVLPPALVDADGIVSGAGDRVDLATVVAVAIDTDRSDLDGHDELADSLTGAVQLAERLAAEHSIDRIRVAADRYLFLAGAGHDDDGADDALGFASALTAELQQFCDMSPVAFTVHIGVSTGPVATGVLVRGSLTFGAWGEPVRRALAISSLSASDEILVDSTTVAAAAPTWTLRPADVVDLADMPMSVSTLVPDHGVQPVVTSS